MHIFVDNFNFYICAFVKKIRVETNKIYNPVWLCDFIQVSGLALNTTVYLQFKMCRSICHVCKTV